MRTNQKAAARGNRRARVRQRVRGTSDRPRLSVYRSERHIYAQVVIDGAKGQTVIAVSTRSAELREQLKKTWDVGAAKQVGLLTARRCQEKGIKRVVFDRDGFLYHGRVAAVAEGAREGGLEF